MAFLALFVALGGTATAASQYIDGKKIKKNTITSKQVKNGTLLAKDFKSGQLPRGRAGIPGAPGSAGATGSAGAAGPAGSPGTAGLTLKTSSLPDAVRTPTASAVTEAWGTPPDSEFHAIGSASGYAFKMACGDVMHTHSADTFWTWNYDNVMRIRIAGTALANSDAGGGQAQSATGKQSPFMTNVYNTDYSGEVVNTFSMTTGEVVRVSARQIVDSDSCEYRNVKLYVWS